MGDVAGAPHLANQVAQAEGERAEYRPILLVEQAEIVDIAGDLFCRRNQRRTLAWGERGDIAGARGGRCG